MIEAVTHTLKVYVEDFELKIDNSSEKDKNVIENQIEELEMRIVWKYSAIIIADFKYRGYLV